MYKYFSSISKPQDWKPQDPRSSKHWNETYSTIMLAKAWHNAQDIPGAVHDVLKNSDTKFNNLQIIFGFPDYAIEIPGGVKSFQNDLLLIARNENELFTIAVEGKKDESFGETVDNWLKASNYSESKINRLDYLTQKLGIDFLNVNSIRYSLINSAASAIISAEKMFSRNALMLVHSFSQTNHGFEDYKEFVRLFNVQANINKLTDPVTIKNINLYFGWINA